MTDKEKRLRRARIVRRAMTLAERAKRADATLVLTEAEDRAIDDLGAALEGIA